MKQHYLWLLKEEDGNAESVGVVMQSSALRLQWECVRHIMFSLINYMNSVVIYYEYYLVHSPNPDL